MFSKNPVAARFASVISLMLLMLFLVSLPARASAPLPGDVVVNLDHPPAVMHIYDKHDQRILFVKDKRTVSVLVSYTDSLFVKVPLLKKAPTAFLESGQEVVLLLHPWSRGNGIISILPDGSKSIVQIPVTVEHHASGEPEYGCPENTHAVVLSRQDGETRISNPCFVELAKENTVVRDVVFDLLNGINTDSVSEKEKRNTLSQLELVRYEVLPTEQTWITMRQMQPHYVSADIYPDREVPTEPNSYHRNLIAKVESRDFSYFPAEYGQSQRQIPDSARLIAKSLVAKGFELYDCEAPSRVMLYDSYGHLSFQRKTKTGYVLINVSFEEKSPEAIHQQYGGFKYL